MSNGNGTAESQARDAAKQTQSISEAMGAGNAPKVNWDDSSMRTTYANVVNGTSTQEEVSIFFGTNQTWNLKEETELKINLSDRIVLTPLAARRLWVLLGGILKAYETRFGPLASSGDNGGEKKS